MAAAWNADTHEMVGREKTGDGDNALAGFGVSPDKQIPEQPETAYRLGAEPKQRLAPLPAMDSAQEIIDGVKLGHEEYLQLVALAMAGLEHTSA